MTPKRAIGGKKLNSGIRGGLWDEKHRKKMGPALCLFGKLVHWQTKQKNSEGLVLGGRSLTYQEISDDTGWSVRSLQRWMARLRKHGYVDVKHSSYSKMVIRILHAKKFNPQQLEFPATGQEPIAPNVAEMTASSPPEVAELSPPSVADMDTKSGGLNHRTYSLNRSAGSGAADAAEKNNAAQFAAIGVDQPLAEWIPLELWLAYVEMRKKIRRPLTDHGVLLAIRTLAELKSAGHDPRAVLENSILNSYTGLFAPKNSNGKGVSRAEQRTHDNLKAAGFVQ